jgi:hypothetical protein
MKDISPMRVGRRAVLQGSLGLAALGIAKTRSHIRAQGLLDGEFTGDCSREPGVQLILDWQAGFPVLSITDLVAPRSWETYTHPALPLALRIPPNWTAIAGYATSFSQSGRPEWTEDRPAVPQLVLLRLVTEDESAAFEYAVGNVPVANLDPEEFIPSAQQSLLGEDPELRNVCTYRDEEVLSQTAFSVDRWQGNVVVASVSTFGVANSLSPTTTVTVTNLFGPRRDFEELAREVFVRLLVQFMGNASGTGSGGGGGGDDDDDDGGDDEG